MANLFFKVCSAMMHAIITGCSGAIVMNLIVCKKNVEKQWRQQVVMTTVHKSRYLKRADLCLKCLIWTINEQNVLYNLNW